MTERLTTNKGQCVACIGCIEESNCKVECGAIDDCLEKLTEYETAEEDGRLVVLPCNVGDPVYVLRQSWNGWNIDKKKFTYGMIGKVDKTIFLTYEEAEKALEEMTKNE